MRAGWLHGFRGISDFEMPRKAYYTARRNSLETRILLYSPGV